MNKRGQLPMWGGALVAIVVFIAVFGGIWMIIYRQGNNVNASNATEVTKTAPQDDNLAGPQIWDLTNDAGQVATVIVTPFTYSGTFKETDSSAGWFVNIPGVEPIRVPLSGTVAHTGAGDRWSFTNTIMQGSISILFQGEGTANGQYPAATTVSGTVGGTIKTPMDEGQQVSSTWAGSIR